MVKDAIHRASTRTVWFWVSGPWWSCWGARTPTSTSSSWPARGDVACSRRSSFLATSSRKGLHMWFGAVCQSVDLMLWTGYALQSRFAVITFGDGA